MSWKSGARFAEEIWRAVKPNLKEGTEKKVAKRLIHLFEDRDCDTLYDTDLFKVVFPPPPADAECKECGEAIVRSMDKKLVCLNEHPWKP